MLVSLLGMTRHCFPALEIGLKTIPLVLSFGTMMAVLMKTILVDPLWFYCTAFFFVILIAIRRAKGSFSVSEILIVASLVGHAVQSAAAALLFPRQTEYDSVLDVAILTLTSLISLHFWTLDSFKSSSAGVGAVVFGSSALGASIAFRTDAIRVIVVKTVRLYL